MPSALDILGLVLSIVSVSELFKIVLQLLAERLPSGRWQKVEVALEKIDIQLRRLERSKSLSEEGSERKENDRLAKRLDDLSLEVEEWEERGLSRFLDYPGAMKLLRRCRELEGSAAHLRTRLRQIETLEINSAVPPLWSWMPGEGLGHLTSNAATQGQQRSTSPPQSSAGRASGFAPSSRMHQPEPRVQSSRWATWNPDPAFRPSPPPSPSPEQENANPPFASGVEYAHPPEGPLPQTQSWATWLPNPRFEPSPPPPEPRELNHRATAANRRPRSSPQKTGGSVPVKDDKPSWPTYALDGQPWATWLPNPALQPSPPPQPVEHLLAPAPGSPGLFGRRSPTPESISRDMLENPELEPLAPRFPSGSMYRD